MQFFFSPREALKTMCGASLNSFTESFKGNKKNLVACRLALSCLPGILLKEKKNTVYISGCNLYQAKIAATHGSDPKNGL